MKAEERAEKTVAQIKDFPKDTFRSWDEMKEIIAAQIAEAEREAYRKGFEELQSHRMESTKQAFERGWTAARTKAAGIARAGHVVMGPIIAERIEKMDLGR